MRPIVLPDEKVKSAIHLLPQMAPLKELSNNVENLCPSCRKCKLKVYYHIHEEKVSLFWVKCQKCFYVAIDLFSTIKINDVDLLIYIDYGIPELSSRLKFINKTKCPTCKNRKNESIHHIDEKFHGIHIIRCEKCKFTWVLIYFNYWFSSVNYDIEMARNLSKKYPEAALVFCVTAFEVYCKHVFQYSSDLHQYFIEKRKISLQQLNTVKEIFRLAFNIDIVKLNRKAWNFLNEIFQKRHSIIHNASRDKSGKKLTITPEYVAKAIDCVYNHIILVEKEFIKDKENRNGSI